MTLPAATSSAVVASPAVPAPVEAGGRRIPLAGTGHVGPQWFPVLMGTGILATCTENLAQSVPALHALAVLVVAAAWALLAVVGSAFVRHALRDPARFRSTLTDLAVAPFYGAVSMGLLAVGSATLAVAGQHASAAAVAAWILWTAGTVLGVATALLYPVRLLAAAPAERGAPTPVWALPVVAPMVSASGGAVLAATLSEGRAAAAMLLLCGVLFALALGLGSAVFVVAYGHLARGGSLPLQGSPAIWIPLGVAGQSTAAANLLLAEAADVVPPAAAEVLRGPVVAYSAVALTLGAAAAVVALRITVRALRGGMTFSLAWWSFTFPVGTMSFGAFALGTTLDAPWLLGISAGICACLAGTVGLCLVRSARLWTERP